MGHIKVKTLQRHDDIFQPLTLFESLAINIQDQKRILAQLYNWFIN